MITRFLLFLVWFALYVIGTRRLEDEVYYIYKRKYLDKSQAARNI